MSTLSSNKQGVVYHLSSLYSKLDSLSDNSFEEPEVRDELISSLSRCLALAEKQLLSESNLIWYDAQQVSVLTGWPPRTISDMCVRGIFSTAKKSRKRWIVHRKELAPYLLNKRVP